MPYTVTTWVNDAAPALSATNLNKLTDELRSQAVAKSVTHSLPTWTNNAAPAVTDAAPLNEMERVAAAVGATLGVTYVPTSWQAGWTPARNATRLNKLEVAARTNRTAIDAGTPPPVGTSLARFSAFKNSAFGPDSAYPGSGAIFNRKCNPAPSGNGFDNQGDPCPVPWNDNWSGIFEVTTPIGPGLDFRFGTAMPRASGKGLQIADINHILSNNLPADFDLTWDIIFPATGNPNGFPPFAGDPTTDEWNLIIEFTDAGFQSNGIGIANFSTPKPAFYVTSGIGIDNQKRKGRTSWAIQMDTWYHFAYRGRLSKGSDGWCILDITPQGGALDRIFNVTGPTSNPADGHPYIELGQYGMNVTGKNQMTIANMRNLRG